MQQAGILNQQKSRIGHLAAAADGLGGDADIGGDRSPAPLGTERWKGLAMLASLERRRGQQIGRDDIALAAPSVYPDFDHGGSPDVISPSRKVSLRPV